MSESDDRDLAELLERADRQHWSKGRLVNELRRASVSASEIAKFTKGRR